MKNIFNPTRRMMIVRFVLMIVLVIVIAAIPTYAETLETEPILPEVHKYTVDFSLHIPDAGELVIEEDNEEYEFDASNEPIMLTVGDKTFQCVVNNGHIDWVQVEKPSYWWCLILLPIVGVFFILYRFFANRLLQKMKNEEEV